MLSLSAWDHSSCLSQEWTEGDKDARGEARGLWVLLLPRENSPDQGRDEGEGAELPYVESTWKVELTGCCCCPRT